jgi:hypothetical protein
MIMNFVRHILLFLLFSIQAITIVKAQDGLEQILKPLEMWATDYPSEKVYVHLDKPYYMAGDTIWFKTYTVVGATHQLSSISGAVYVDLISSTDSVVSSLKLPLIAGMAKGNIDLSVELKAGSYRLRAYTQWMRNADSDYFYDRVLHIGAIHPYGVQTQATLQYEETKEKKLIGMQIQFLDARGKPLMERSVEYLIRTQGELFSQRKAKTNDEGLLLVPLNEKSLRDSANAFIVSEIRLDKGKIATNIFPINIRYDQADVQFFPESGDLVAGIPNRVAFKAIGMNGLGVAVKGEIMDENQQILTAFNSVHVGMGQFTITPESGKKYTAQVSFPDGSTIQYLLPEVKTSGYVLSVYPQAAADTVRLRIMCSNDKLKQPISIVAQIDGEVFYAADLSPNRPVNNLYVPLAQNISGIVQFTLFSKGQAVNERIAFVEQPDTLQISLIDLKPTYSPRSEHRLTLNVSDKGTPILGNFSLAVVDEGQVPIKEEQETTIFSQLLLQSNLKGYIEKPNYYFTEITNEKRDHLDLLLMTQGYRRFVWSDLTAGKLAKPIYPAEKMVSSISGKLLTLRGKPVANGKIILLSVAANIALETKTDIEGKFVFENLFLTDSVRFTIQGRSEKGNDKVEIVLDGIPSLGVTSNKNAADLSLNINQQLNTYFESTHKHDDELEALGLESRLIKLNEVVINARTSKALPRSYNLNGPGRADQVISSNELGTCPTLRACLEGRVRGVVFRTEQTGVGPVNFPTSTRGGKMQVVVDGRILDFRSDGDLQDLVGIFEQNLIDPTQILSLEVLRSPSLTNIYGGGATAGVILINTKGWSPTERTDYSAKLYAPKGFASTREFYSPKYGVSERINTLADQRSTVYWNPVISVNKTGRASVSYFNTPNLGTYRIVIEGIGANGQLGRGVFRYHIAN